MTIGGTGTLLNFQDTIAVNVEARTLDDALSATAIASVPFDQTETSALGGGTMGLCTGFELASTVALDGGSSARYSFVVTVALPVLGAMNSAGYVTLQVGGPEDVLIDCGAVLDDRRRDQAPARPGPARRPPPEAIHDARAP